MARLADHGLAGLGFGMGFAHERVPEALVEAAAERDFPLVEIPYDTPFIAVTEKAFARLVNEQYALLQRSIAVQERLQRIVLSERGLDAIAAALATLDRRDHRGLRRPRRAPGAARASGASCPTTPWPPSAPSCASAPAAPRRAASCRRIPIWRRARWRCPSRAPRRPACRRPGWWPSRTPAACRSSTASSLHQAVTVVALELLRRHVAASTERRLAGDVLSELVTGTVSGPDLARRLEPFGLGGRVTALVLAAGAHRRQGRRPEAFEAALAGALRDEAVSGLVATAGTHVCALLPGFLDEELFELASACSTAWWPRWAPCPPPARAVRWPPATRAAPFTRRAAPWRRGRCRPVAPSNGARATATGPAPRHDLPRPRLLPAAALAAGLRRLAALLRVHARPDRGRRGPLRRRAGALARGVHRVQRPVGGARRGGCSAIATRCATGCARWRS